MNTGASAHQPATTLRVAWSLFRIAWSSNSNSAVQHFHLSRPKGSHHCTSAPRVVHRPAAPGQPPPQHLMLIHSSRTCNHAATQPYLVALAQRWHT
jgi:hypothetical protein